jgi:two-component system cell cycle response regulator
MNRNFGGGSGNEGDSENEKTVFSSDTFHGKIQDAEKAPPSVVALIGPPGYTGKQWALTQPETIVGRSVECSIFIDDRSLSRNHCRFMLMGPDVSVVDMGSTNKTVVNGMTLPPLIPHQLKNNDQVKTGNVVFKFLERGSLESMSTQEVQERVTKDALTGAYTKGELLQRAPEIVKRAETLGDPLSLIVFDIDFFKKINDTYGHPGGDYVLRELGKVIGTKVVRSQDYFSRFGGEEFVILLLGSNARHAWDVAERIRLTIQNHPFVYEGKQIPVTISLGIAERYPTEKTWEALFDRADKALYHSKKTGRNKVTVAQ